MPEAVLDDRRRSLEEAFFKKKTEQHLEKLRLQREQEEARDSLASASGITDADLLGRLAALGIRAETLAALTLIPLVEVAWADGKMEAREREAVLRGAEASGIAVDSPSYALLEIWTADRPAPDLMISWRQYISTLCAELSADQKWHLEERILGRAREVAAAAGGFLGLGSRVSREEEAVLGELQKAFGASG